MFSAMLQPVMPAKYRAQTGADCNKSGARFRN